MEGSKLILPRQYAQMSKPIVFWWSKELDHLMHAPGVDVKTPSGYQRIECRHAHEVELWSSRLRAQEQRIRQMQDEEFYQYEDRIRRKQIEELRKSLESCIDVKNRLFIKAAIEYFEKRREMQRPSYIKRETYMAVESEEGIAP
jgi:hypothetical protein